MYLKSNNIRRKYFYIKNIKERILFLRIKLIIIRRNQSTNSFNYINIDELITGFMIRKMPLSIWSI